MPYQNINELPESVQNVLPKRAQEVYQEAYNSAFDQYAKPSERRSDASREETAHRVAWSAVKKAGYQKSDNDSWYKTS